jgi:hypothetical protein
MLVFTLLAKTVIAVEKGRLRYKTSAQRRYTFG